MKQYTMKQDSNKIYTDIHDLPLSVFIEVLCADRYDLLIIQGEYPQHELLGAWNSLYCQYLDLLEDHQSLYILQIRSEVVILTQQIMDIEGAVGFLTFQYDERLVQIIRRNGIIVKMDPDNEAGMFADINKVKGRLARMRLQLQEKLAELATLDSDTARDKIDRKTFYQVLMRLAKFQGVATINPKSITAADYVYLLKEYNTHCLHLNNKEHGQES